MKTSEQIDKDLAEFLQKESYSQLRFIERRGICGIMRFAFTTAIVEGLDRSGYEGRWCYPHSEIKNLALAYLIWDGKGDPQGPWIKYKGRVEYSNPNLKE